MLVVGDNTAWSIGEEIKNGQITNSVLKPIRYLQYKASQSIGGILYRLMLFTLPVVGVMFLLRNYLTLAHDGGLYFFLFFSIFISYALYFLIYFNVGMITFWTSDSQGFAFTCLVITSFMQGGFIPLDLLPKWFLVISEYLPFKYLFFVPVGMVTNRITFEYTMILIPLVWCLVLYLFAQFLYKKGMRKYEGYGI